MKRAFLVLLLAAPLTAAFAQTNAQAIQGRVLRAGTLEPIPNAIPWGAGLSAEHHAKYSDRGKPVLVTPRSTLQAQLDLISVPGLTASPSTGR